MTMHAASCRHLSQSRRLCWGWVQHTGCVRLNLQNKQSLFARYYGNGSAPKGSRSYHGNPVVGYLRSLKWVPIPLGVGFAYIGYQQFGHVREREERKLKAATDPEELVAKDWQVKIYTALPLNAVSRLWGRVNNIDLPMWMREPFYKLYIWAFNCNMEEAVVRDLKFYRNLGQFFRRRLAPGCRPVDKEHPMVSPSDGKILHFGRVHNGEIEQVKGITYSMAEFVGPYSWSRDSVKQRSRDQVESGYSELVKVDPKNCLYHCVIYLAPGDYHGFHSPAKCRVAMRRHFPGDLLSVNPGIARWVKGLFNLNERAVYVGEWQHGFFAMAAVGATNVGSINVYFDQALKTNSPGHYTAGCHYDLSFNPDDQPGILLKKGEAFGEFNLGSTIVLIFEAPSDFEFKIEHGQSIKYGQALGGVETVCRWQQG